MSQSPRSAASLPRRLTAPETWGFGFSGLLLWLGTAPAIHAALGAQAIWVWLPGTIVGVLLNLQVKQLGQHFPQVAGGTPNYTTRLLQQFPALARYSAIGYLLGWLSVPSINAIILTDLIQENLAPLGIACPVMLLRLGFVCLPFIVAFSGIRTVGILHTFFVFPAIGFLTTFCLQGIGWLAFSPASPGLLPDTWTGIAAIDWMKWFFIATYAVYSCETASSFVAESRQPSITLRCLSVTAGFIPIIYLAGSWVLMRLDMVPGSGDSAYLSLVTAAASFWGVLAPALVTFLITSGCLLSSTTAVSNCPRILYQLAIDGYLPPVFAVVSRRGVLEPSLLATLLLSLLCLLSGTVANIVMVTGTGYLLSIMALHLGLWLDRQQPEARWPWWSLGFFGLEAAVLVIGGFAWGWQAFALGVLLPLVIGSIGTVLPRWRVALFQPDWWQRRDRPRPYQAKTDWAAFQVSMLIVLVCGAVSIGWLVRAGLERYRFGSHMALFSILLITVAFVGVAIAAWTSLSQIAAITEAQETVERTLHELQQQTQQAQALNRVVQSIRNSLDLTTIFATATAEVTQLLGVHRTAIVEYAPDRGCWRVVACHCLDASLPDTTGLEVPDEGNLYAAQLKQFQLVRVDSTDQVNDPVNQQMARQFPHTIWLILPIVLNNKIWGALSLSKALDNAPWQEEEVALGRQVVDQLAIAIQQAQLYQQTQQELSQRQQADAALQQLNRELEERVQERTQQLQQEVHSRQQAEARFRQIFHISPHGIAIGSLQDRRILEVNDAYCQILGYSREEMMGGYADEFIHFVNPAEQGKVQRQLMATGVAHNLECTIRTRTGAIRTAIASAEFVEMDGIAGFLCIVNDITDRKQAEAALAQSEARFQKLATASPAQIHILVTHLDGSLIRFEYVSPTVWELRELSPEQLLQDPSPIYEQIHPDDRTDYFAARNHSLSSMTPFFHEYRIVPPSGRVKWVRVNSRPERREKDEIYWYGIVLDVSDRKQVEAALRRSERWLQNFSQQISTMVYTLVQDYQGASRFEYISSTCEALLEIPAEQAMYDSRFIKDLIYPDDRPARAAALAHSRQTLEPYQSEYRILTPSGTLKWVQAYAQVEARGDGAFAWYGVLIDISDRKGAEAALRESEQRFRSLIENLQVGVTLHGSDSRFLLSNPAAQNLLGLTEAQLLDKTLIDPHWHAVYEDGALFPPEAYPVIQAIATGRPIHNVVMGIYRSDRSLVWLLVSVAPQLAQDQSVRSVICTFSDITERKQIERQLRASLKEKEVLLREVYHRVKNNMQLVSSLLRLQATTTDDPNVLKLLDESQQRVKTMALIHERLYRSENLARINAATYMQDLVNDLMRSYGTTASRIRVTLDLADLELDLDTAIPCGLIINELVSNALKHAFPQQQGNLKLQFEQLATGAYCLIVSDDGVGIPDQVDPQQTESLGMQLVYGLTEQLGGTMALDRQGGSQFRIVFGKRL